MNRQLLYLLLALVLIVTASPILMRLMPQEGLSQEGLSHEGFAPPKGGLSQTPVLGQTEGFAPPRVAPFSLDPPRPAEPHSIQVPSSPSAPVYEAFEGVSSVKPVVEVSDTAYNAMSLKQRSDLLRGVQQMVREEIRAARANPFLPHDSDSDSDSDSASSAQGQDYQRRCEKDQDEEYRCPKNPDGSCPPVPDLSQYIRKDQIPCWGCAVDY